MISNMQGDEESVSRYNTSREQKDGGMEREAVLEECGSEDGKQWPR